MIEWLTRRAKVVRKHESDEGRLQKIREEHREEAARTPDIREQTAVLEWANRRNGFVQSLNAGFRMNLDKG